MLMYVKGREEFFTGQLNEANRDSAISRSNTFGNIGSISKKMFKSDAGYKFEFNGRHTLY